LAPEHYPVELPRQNGTSLALSRVQEVKQMIDDPTEQLPRGAADDAMGESETNTEERRADGGGREEVPFHIPRD
jgi:hypothetical protein